MWQPGKPNAIESESPSKHAAVVFEDDGESGYFYAIDRSVTKRTAAGNRTYDIVDTLHAYNVSNMQAASIVAEIVWTTDGTKAALKLAGKIYAAFDFSNQQGWCLSGFPPPSNQPGHWTKQHTWDDVVLDLFTSDPQQSIALSAHPSKPWWKLR